ICLLIILPLVVMIEGTFIIRLSLVITAVFFAIAATPIFLWLPERAKAKALPAGETYLSVAFKQLGRTIRTARQFKEFIKFIIAFLVYNDAVIMALDFAAIIGAVLFGLDQQGLIIFIIVVQLTNVAGAYLFGHLVDRVGGKPTLSLSIVLMLLVVGALYFNQTQVGFFVIGAVAGVAMAGIQSISRTMVAMMAPPGQGAEFFGFFAVTGRTSSFIGPVVYGWIAAEAALWYQAHGQSLAMAEQSGQRLAILSIGVFLIIGLVLLGFVNEKDARK
ncbi:MAG TPA: MFS transporter, partial [Anaerolineae bacterium]|nr:MFS transporter [Anaerolineae bacterium]